MNEELLTEDEDIPREIAEVFDHYLAFRKQMDELIQLTNRIEHCQNIAQESQDKILASIPSYTSQQFDHVEDFSRFEKKLNTLFDQNPISDNWQHSSKTNGSRGV